MGGGGGGILQNAPIFALDCNITRVDIQVKLDSSQSVLDLLIPFKKLKSISLHQSNDGFTYRFYVCFGIKRTFFGNYRSRSPRGNCIHVQYLQNVSKDKKM